MSRTVKAVVSGVLLIAGIILLWTLFKVLWWLFIFLLPVISLLAVLYVIGYAIPKDWSAPIEKWIRKQLDWLDFNAPAVLWPWINKARAFLDWLGLRVGTKAPSKAHK